MKPVNSGGTKKYYSNAAGAILWDGPDIPCLNLCKGDSIGDVQFKAAQLICILKDELDLSDLNLKTLFSDCTACPDPEKKLQTVLQELINKVVYLLTVVKLNSTSAEEKKISLASCLREANADGDQVDVLYHSDYTILIGRKICSVLTEMAGLKQRLETIEGEVDNLTTRVGVLEQTDDALELIKERVLELETEADNMANVLGNPTKLAGILTEECEGAGADGELMALDGSGTSLYAGKSSSVADSMKRLWRVTCDLRTAVKIIQDSCCQLSCDDIIIDFDIKLLENRSKVRLYFVAKSHLPQGFKDVKSVGNTLKISDQDGNSAQFFIKIWEAVTEVDGIEFDLADTALNPRQNYYFSMDAAVKNEKLTCVKCITNQSTYVGTDCPFCTIKAVDTSGASDSELVIIYEESSTVTT